MPGAFSFAFWRLWLPGKCYQQRSTKLYNLESAFKVLSWTKFTSMLYLDCQLRYDYIHGGGGGLGQDKTEWDVLPEMLFATGDCIWGTVFIPTCRISAAISIQYCLQGGSDRTGQDRMACLRCHLLATRHQTWDAMFSPMWIAWAQRSIAFAQISILHGGRGMGQDRMGQDVFAEVAFLFRRATKCSSQSGHRTTRFDCDKNRKPRNLYQRQNSLPLVDFFKQLATRIYMRDNTHNFVQKSQYPQKITTTLSCLNQETKSKHQNHCLLITFSIQLYEVNIWNKYKKVTFKTHSCNKISQFYFQSSHLPPPHK